MAIITQVEGNLYSFGNSRTTQAVTAETADSLFNKGAAAESTGRTNEALEFYRQALAHCSETPKALLNMGSIAFNNRNLVLAEEYYRKALAIDPCYALAHYNLGNCLSERWGSQRAEAIKHYLKALAHKPDYGPAHYNLAVEYAKMEENRKALNHFQLYLRYNGGDIPLYISYAKGEIWRLSKLAPQVLAKPIVSEQAETPLADSQVG